MGPLGAPEIRRGVGWQRTPVAQVQSIYKIHNPSADKGTDFVLGVNNSHWKKKTPWWEGLKEGLNP